MGRATKLQLNLNKTNKRRENKLNSRANKGRTRGFKAKTVLSASGEIKQETKAGLEINARQLQTQRLRLRRERL